MRLGKNATLDDFQASPVTQQPASLPFSDDFSTTSDGSQLSRFWTDRQGNITVINGHATGVGPGDANLSSLNGVSQANVVVAGNVALAAGQDVGLVTRYSGPLASNFYLGQLASAGAGFQATIWKNIGGKYTKLTTGLTIGSGAGTLEFEAVGPSLKVILNGQLLAFVDDSSLVNGSVGIRLSEGATLDDFHADSVVQSAAGLPFSDNFSSPSDASQLSHFWTDQRGNVTVVNGRATGTGTGNINVATLNGVNQVNVAVTGEVALAAGQAGGLVTRYGGPLESNFYLGQLVGTAGGWEASIWKNVGGKYTKLSTGLTAATGAGTLEFEAVGPSLTLIFNGQLLAFADDTALNVGSVGMRLSQNATLDNFQADAVVPLLASPPFSDDFATTSEGSQLSRFWTDQRGNITVVSGKATGIAPGNANLSTLNGLNKDNVTVKGVVALAAGQRVGLVTRYGGPLEANFYLGQLASSGVGFQATIWKNIGGVYTKLSTGLTVESGTGTLEFQTIGSTLTLLLDGNVLATATDTHLASGSVGMRLGQDTAVSSFQAP